MYIAAVFKGVNKSRCSYLVSRAEQEGVQFQRALKVRGVVPAPDRWWLRSDVWRRETWRSDEQTGLQMMVYCLSSFTALTVANNVDWSQTKHQ